MINKKLIKKGLIPIFVLLLAFTAVAGIYDALIPERISVFSDEPLDMTGIPPLARIDYKDESLAVAKLDGAAVLTEAEAEVTLFGYIPFKSVSVNVLERVSLYPGGMPFGVKFHTQGVLVVGTSEVESDGVLTNPAYDAGIRVKDVITGVNGKSVNTIEEVTAQIEESNGGPVIVTVTRGGGEFKFELKPVMSTLDGKYKAGLWIRDSIAGIGTVTFIDPADNSFAGLGHGICDMDTGELMPLMRGTVVDVTISGVTKGKAGYPGELKGYFSTHKLGALTGNTPSGVYGVLSELPNSVKREPMPIGLSKEIKEGKATIFCTTDDNEVREYKTEIIKINRGSSDLKNFIIKITDPELLETTGGIVQGMSGSPVIQGGKIVGAVTHVLINDPTKGYGIFIENMLRAVSGAG